MRTRFSPMIILFGTSHEQLILWHRTSGNIIMLFLLTHGVLYLNYYIVSGTLIEHLQGLHASTGVIAVSLGAGLAGTSLDAIRKWSYRVFFLCHLTIGLGIMPILFFHASPLRLYTIEALALFILDRILRRLDTVTEPVTITQIPHTDLMKIQVPIASSKLSRFEFNPGQHVYVAMPSEKSSKISKRLLSNPFTVAKVSSTGITLVLRALQGPTTQSLWLHARRFHSKPLLSIEGPYGCPISIPNLITNFDRILLVAGGIGATFTWPIYGALREQLEAESRDPDQLNFIWAVRSSAEASWISDSEEQAFSEDPNIQIYLTRHHDLAESLDHELSDEGIEMDDMHTNPGLIGGIKPRIGRPFLKDIVEQIFGINTGERVAVLFCGPQGMGRELRTHVRGWTVQGRDVMWHEESFGM
ncbi:hypothetical protein N7478_007726 [Penicillium angulare]|uniref:uncharacterized protein n=1 Tax=Penicillium angulare TaxID=116970 RepID=UPI00253FAE67|nr:uncharacterized protein N7478_007726 [Penicillium angulare]KAJ5272601.1 hypothetical protein N7478_007726 [Penicillium angulare]